MNKPSLSSLNYFIKRNVSFELMQQVRSFIHTVVITLTGISQL